MIVVKKILLFLYGFSVLTALFMVLGPILRGEQHWWITQETLKAYSEWGIFDAILTSCFYLIFYSSIGLLAFYIFKKYQQRSFYPSSDPYYANVNKEHIALYQHYFNNIINHVDVDNYTKWSKSEETYDRNRLDKDDEYIHKILNNEVKSDGLNAEYLLVMINQYFFADVFQREMDESEWVKKLLNRQSVDYFPSAGAVYQILTEVMT